MKLPPSLKKGDTIGIICPGGFMPLQQIKKSIEFLKSWGYQIKIGKTTGTQNNYFSGTDEERLIDLQTMLDDKNVSAILCARGGYGISRIIDKIKFKKFIKNPKWIIGFSDVTLLHSHINTNIKIATLHAPMSAAFNNGEYKNDYILSLKKSIKGDKIKIKFKTSPINNIGIAKGELIGGNLTLIAHSVGSNSQYKTKNKILFLEDVGEYLYNIDRMIIQLKRTGFFNHLSGLIVGGFTELKDTNMPFGKTIFEIFQEHFCEFNFPICYHFPVGHQTENMALKIGANYQLNVNNKEVSLIEL